jgi:hypothetical protein
VLGESSFVGVLADVTVRVRFGVPVQLVKRGEKDISSRHELRRCRSVAYPTCELGHDAAAFDDP